MHAQRHDPAPCLLRAGWRRAPARADPVAGAEQRAQPRPRLHGRLRRGGRARRHRRQPVADGRAECAALPRGRCGRDPRLRPWAARRLRVDPRVPLRLDARVRADQAACRARHPVVPVGHGAHVLRRAVPLARRHARVRRRPDVRRAARPHRPRRARPRAARRLAGLVVHPLRARRPVLGRLRRGAPERLGQPARDRARRRQRQGHPCRHPVAAAVRGARRPARRHPVRGLPTGRQRVPRPAGLGGGVRHGGAPRPRPAHRGVLDRERRAPIAGPVHLGPRPVDRARRRPGAPAGRRPGCVLPAPERAARPGRRAAVLLRRSHRGAGSRPDRRHRPDARRRRDVGALAVRRL